MRRQITEVPSSIAQVRLQAKYEFLNYFRFRRFLISALAIGVIIAILLTAVVGYYRPASFMISALSFYNSWWGMTASFVVILSGIFFGGDAISAEFQNKTGYYLVPNPIRRSSIYVGKWIAAFIASSIILAIFAAITIANGAFYFGANIPYEFVESLAFSWVYLIAVLGFTFFFSSLFNRDISYSILVTAILFLFAFTIIQELVSTLAQIEPWFILTYGSSIIGNVMTIPYPLHKVISHGFGGGSTNPNAPTFTTFNATVPEGLAIMLIYFVVTAILGHGNSSKEKNSTRKFSVQQESRSGLVPWRTFAPPE